MAILAQLIDDVVANKFEIDSPEVSIGRHPSSDIQIDDASVSGAHAVIVKKANEHFPEYNEFYLVDKSSTNGTFINEQRIADCVRLHNNDQVRIAWNKFKFVDDCEVELEKTVHMIQN